MCTYKMESLNLELTTECPLNCPQCYCTLNVGKHLPLEEALFWIEDAHRCGITTLNLSGGETMCYPNLYDVIRAASERHMACNVALSGYRFDQNALSSLISAGVSGIFISLNGSTEEINRKSRNGYSLSIQALQILKDADYKNTTINWVMQSTNADDFANIVHIAERYHVSRVVVLGIKPDSQNELKNFPSRSQMQYVRDFIINYRGNVTLRVESCFSPLLALLGESFLFGNSNTGLYKGCGAGLVALSINVDGLLTPCRHLYYPESWDTMAEYWEKSPVLSKIRLLEEEKSEPCSSCKFSENCRHCLAITCNTTNKISLGNPNCSIYTDRKAHHAL